jgi:hypothetical protein
MPVRLYRSRPDRLGRVDDEVNAVDHPWRALGVLIVGVVIASSCSNGTEPSPQADPTSTEASATPPSEVPSGASGPGAPNPAALPESTAPHGLGEVGLPDTADGIVALFDRLPANVSGRQRTDERPAALASRINASYGTTEPVGCATVGLQAMNVSTGEFFPEGWTAEMVVAMFTTGADWQVEDFGRDGELLWVMFTTTCGAEGSPSEDVVSTLNWGVTGSPWVFSASADAAGLRDELTMAFVTAAG